MPGDPLRAKFIAENFLTEYKLTNSTRNMLGYTGYYKGEGYSHGFRNGNAFYWDIFL